MRGKTVLASLPIPAVEALDQICARTGQSRSRLIAEAVTARLVDERMWPPKPAAQ